MMERAGGFDQGKYLRDYQKANILQVKLQLNRKTDGELIDWLEQQANRQGYIKGLIRRDMEEKR